MRGRTVWGVLWIVVGLAVSIGGMVLAIVDPARAVLGALGFGAGDPAVRGRHLPGPARPTRAGERRRAAMGHVGQLLGPLQMSRCPVPAWTQSCRIAAAIR